jgi:hypothetical protein
MADILDLVETWLDTLGGLGFWREDKSIICVHRGTQRRGHDHKHDYKNIIAVLWLGSGRSIYIRLYKGENDNNDGTDFVGGYEFNNMAEPGAMAELEKRLERHFNERV